MITEEILDFGDVRGIRVGRSLLGNPLMTVIFYHLDDLLIDTGPYCARRSVKHYLDRHGVERALLTHYHEDHAGNAGVLVDRGIRVFGHEETVRRLAVHNRLKPYEHIMFGKLEIAQINPLPERVETDHCVLIPIHTPGHSRDHTVYHEPDRGWLFSGDLFLGAKIKYWRRDEDMSTTLESLDRVLKLDFETLFCGHNPRLNNPKRHLESKRQYLGDLVDKVSGLQQQGLGRNRIIALLTKGREKHFAKWLTLGDASYRNMIKAALDVATSNQQQQGS